MKASRPLLGCCCALALAVVPARADELLRYVPSDVTFCLVVRDLKTHLDVLGKSPLAEQLSGSGLGKALKGSPEFKQVLEAEKFLEKSLGMKLAQLRDDVLGDAVVLAYRQGPPGKPEQEQGLLLLRAKDGKTLAELVERLNRLLKETGSLKEVSEVEYGGVKYYRRVEGEEVNFLCLRDRVLIFSGQEAMLREAIALEKKTPAKQEPAIARSLRELGADRALASLWVNPRAFDADLAARLERAAAGEKTLLQTFIGCWKALDGIALTLSLTRDLEIGLALRGRPQALPDPLRRFLDEAALTADLWSRFPDNALVAGAARSSASSWLALLGAFQTKESFEAMQEQLNRSLGAFLGGKDAVKEVLPHVGPDWGGYVAAPSSGEKGWFPAMLFALRVAAGDGAMPVDRALLETAQGYVALSLGVWNRGRKDPLSRHVEKHGSLEITYLRSKTGQAIGLQPAFGLCEGYFVIGSTPETIRRFAGPRRAVPSSTEVPLLRMSFTDLRRYLKDRRDPLSAAIAEQHQQTPQQAATQLDRLVEALAFLDRLELTQRTMTGQVTFTLRLRPSQPLRK